MGKVDGILGKKSYPYIEFAKSICYNKINVLDKRSNKIKAGSIWKSIIFL